MYALPYERADGNFTAGTLMIAIVDLTYYASLALQAPYLQNLMNFIR